MRQKTIIFSIITIIILALAGYFYFLNQNPKLSIPDSDIETCFGDADCGWYTQSGNGNKTIFCGNKNVNKNQPELKDSLIAEKNSICVCSNNKCQSATFTLPNN